LVLDLVLVSFFGLGFFFLPNLICRFEIVLRLSQAVCC
jgi:hypothetical protein